MSVKRRSLPEKERLSLIQRRRLSMRQFVVRTKHASWSISHASRIVSNQLLPHNDRPSAPRLRVENSARLARPALASSKGTRKRREIFYEMRKNYVRNDVRFKFPRLLRPREIIMETRLMASFNPSTFPPRNLVYLTRTFIVPRRC